MKRRKNTSKTHPVLTRFIKIRAGWLGKVRPQQRRKLRRKISLDRLVSRRMLRFQKKLDKLIIKTTHLTLNAVIAATLVVSLVWLGPKLFYTFYSLQTDQAQASKLAGDFQLQLDREKLEAEKNAQELLELSKPPYNENLPEGDWLIIPRIGVRSVLQQTASYEEALNTGLWLAPGFGAPGDRNLPMIVAGHRFGFKWWWEDDYWKYHSFYMLPDLEPGDTVEVISGKRKYLYEIYAGEEGTEITDYQADLIIYTCKHLDSPIRIFRYARLVPSEGATPLETL